MKSMIETDFDEPYTAWKADPSPQNNAMMLGKIQPWIDGAIKTHIGESNPLLVSSARRMALEGLRSYDPMRGRLQTHLYNHLQGLKRVNRKQTQILSVPERVALDRYHLDNTTQELANSLGREPTDAELAEHTGFSAKRIAHVRTYKPGVSEGAMQDQETGSEFSGAVINPVGDARNMWLQLVYDDLDPYHQKVMEHSLGMNGRPVLPNHEIARKLNRSPGAISQAKLRIQKMLNEEQDLSPFGG